MIEKKAKVYFRLYLSFFFVVFFYLFLSFLSFSWEIDRIIWKKKKQTMMRTKKKHPYIQTACISSRDFLPFFLFSFSIILMTTIQVLIRINVRNALALYFCSIHQTTSGYINSNQRTRLYSQYLHSFFSLRLTTETTKQEMTSK